MTYYYYLTAAGKQIAEPLQQQFGGILRGKETFTDAILAQDFQAADLLVFVLQLELPSENLHRSCGRNALTQRFWWSVKTSGM